MVDVGAVTINGDGVEDLDTRVWTAEMKKGAKQVMATGKWVVKPAAQATDGQASYDLGLVETVTNLGKEYYHVDLADVTYKDGTASGTASVYDNSNYIRFRADLENSASTTGNIAAGAAIPNEISYTDFNETLGGTTVDGNTTYGGVMKYTLYAYTQDTATENFSVQLNNGGSSIGAISIPAASLYSKNGIPHKIDVYMWSDSADKYIANDNSGSYIYNADEKLYVMAVVDGAAMAGSIASTAEYGSSDVTNLSKNQKSSVILTSFVNFNPAKKTSYTFKGSDWYISHRGNEDAVTLTRDNMDDTSFSEIVINGGTATFTAKTDNVYGVDANVDKALEVALTKAIGSDRIIGIYEEVYNNPASIFTGETNVKLVEKSSGNEVAVANIPEDATMADYLLMVNGVYVDTEIVEKLINVGNVITETSDEKLSARMHFENYATTESAEAIGGLTTGFYKLTMQPRGHMAFSNSKAMYGTTGYMGLSDGFKKKNFKVGENVVSYAFDLYTPDYTYDSDTFEQMYVNVGFFNGTTTSADTNKSISVYILADGKTNDTLTNYLTVKPDTWNTIVFQYDFTEASNDKVTVRGYVNGEKQVEIPYENDNLSIWAASYDAFLRHVRFYTPAYTAVAVIDRGTYIGIYDPAANVTQVYDGNMNVDAIDGINVDNDSSSVYFDKDADIDTVVGNMAVAGYEPLYKTTISSVDDINKAYDANDGTWATSSPSSNNYTHTGTLVKKWVEASGYFDSSSYPTETGGTYTLDESSAAKDFSKFKSAFVSCTLTDAEKGIVELKLVYDKANSKVYNVAYDSLVEGNDMGFGVVTPFEELIAMDDYQDLVSEELIGFAYADPDGERLPRVYSLQASGTELYSLVYENDTATLTYKEYNGEDMKFVIVVSATDADGKAIATKVSPEFSIDASNANGTYPLTFEPAWGEGFDKTKVKSYKLFVFDSLTSAKPMRDSASFGNSAYVAPVEPAE